MLWEYIGELVIREDLVLDPEGLQATGIEGTPDTEIKTRENNRGGFQHDWYTKFMRSNYKGIWGLLMSTDNR